MEERDYEPGEQCPRPQVLLCHLSPGRGLWEAPSLSSVLEDAILHLPDRPRSPLTPGAPSQARLTLPTGVPVAQGIPHQSLASIPGPLLRLLPLLQPPPPEAQGGSAAPVPGPAGSQLFQGPLRYCPVAPAEEDAGKGSVHLEDGHCHWGLDQLSPPSAAGMG